MPETPLHNCIWPPFRPRLIALLLIATASISVSATERSMTWQSAVTGRELKLTVQAGPEVQRRPAPAVIYCINLAAQRVGTESDAEILKSLCADGYTIVTVDFGSHPDARMPHINRDLAKIRDEIRAGVFAGGLRFDQAHVYIVPSGHRLIRDIPYYKDGDRQLALDLIYPSQPRHPMGTVIEFSCDNKDRMGNTSLSICSDTLLDGEAVEGFAVAMADHPVAAPYKGLDPMPDSALKIKAAVRTLRATAETHGMNSRIVPVGFSRGSGMALMLVTTAGAPVFEGAGEHQGVESSVQGAVVMSGRFTYLDLLPGDHMVPRYAKAWGDRETNLEVWKNHGALDYLNGPTLPLFLTINCTEGEDALHQMKLLRKRLADLGSDEIFMMDRNPRGHKVPLDPQILEAMNAYIARQLKP